MSKLIRDVINDLIEATCVEEEGELNIVATDNGQITSLYYLSYKTMAILSQRISRNYKKYEESDGNWIDSDFTRIMRLLCDVAEYDELPVRHNEDVLNKEWEKKLPIPANQPFKQGAVPFGGLTKFYSYDDPHLKAFMLLQAHLSRISDFPIADYAVDTNAVLDQAIRVLQGLIFHIRV